MKSRILTPVLALTLAACEGGEGDLDVFPSPGPSDSAKAIATTATDQPPKATEEGSDTDEGASATGSQTPSNQAGTAEGISSTPDIGNESLPTQAGCKPGSFTTSSGGCMKVTRIATMTFASNQAYVSMAADSNAQYLLTIRDAGNRVYYWEVQRQRNGDKTWETLCTFLDDRKFTGGLAVDQDTIYIGGTARAGTYYSSDATLRRFTFACRELPTLGVASSRGNPLRGDSPFSVYAGNAYFSFYDSRSSYGYGYWYYHTAIQNLDGGVVTPHLFYDFVGGRTLTGQVLRLFSAHSEGAWVVDSEGFLWRVDDDLIPNAWAELPHSLYTDLRQSLHALSAPDPDTVVLGTYSSISYSVYTGITQQYYYGGTLKRYTLDVSGF